MSTARRFSFAAGRENRRAVGGPAVKQAGEFEQTARKLRLDWLNVQVFERSRPVVTLSLDQPLTLNLEQGVDGFTVLPVAVTVGGTTENPTYGVNTMASSMVGRHAGALIGTVADLFTACRGGEAAQKATEEVLRSAQKTVDDLIKDLFVGKEKR